MSRRSRIPPPIVSFRGDVRIDDGFDRLIFGVQRPVTFHMRSFAVADSEGRPSTDSLHLNFKLLIVGAEGGTGKSIFVDSAHTATIGGVDVYPLEFITNVGKITFNCWDTSGQGKEAGGVLTDYYNGGQCAIIIFDATAMSTYGNVATWLAHLRRFCKDIPVVLCGKKVDLKNRRVVKEELASQLGENLPCYDEVSALSSSYNLDEPFLYLARTLTGDPNLQFVESPALAPRDVPIDFAFLDRATAHEIAAMPYDLYQMAMARIRDVGRMVEVCRHIPLPPDANDEDDEDEEYLSDLQPGTLARDRAIAGESSVAGASSSSPVAAYPPSSP
ncbi:hypothetical protein ACJRO7_016375 [Eucalyptus globulus]|uniref:GTP-binding nuclear protein n=1 Tax=Eucalyptus globulus TaxID=34317 RepID=A0ABD3LH11_EUCGL